MNLIQQQKTHEYPIPVSFYSPLPLPNEEQCSETNFNHKKQTRMQKMYKNTTAAKFVTALVLSLVLAFTSLNSANAQIAVTVTGASNATISGTALQSSYTSLANALSALNTVTAMTGPVTFTCFAGSETASPTGLTIGSATLNPVLSATNTFTLNTSGTVTINAGVGTVTPTAAAPDGILKLLGADFVTINGLTLTDGNTTNPATMEYGIALFKRAAGDGCNNNTIQNCTINMQRVNNASGTAPMVEGSVGILVINSTATAATTALTPTNGGTVVNNGTNSGNKFYSNTINGGNYGIVFNGFAASSGVGPNPTATSFLGDLGNDVGGTGVANATTGNSILNFGGGAATNVAAGIRATNQWSINVSNNTVNNNNGSGTNHATTLRGIFLTAGTSAKASCNFNTVTVNGGGTTSALTAIENAIGSTAASTNTIDINNNVIRFSYTTATSGVFTGIVNSSTAGTLNVTNNNIQQTASTNYPSTGIVLGISVGSPAGPVNVTNNTISNYNMTGASGTIRAIVGVTPTGLYSVTGNTIENMSYATAGSTGSIIGIYNLSSATSQNLLNNIIRNFSTPGTGTLNGIQNNTTSGTFQVKGNQISNFSTTSGGAGGFTANGIIWSNATVDISGNTIFSINSTGSTGGIGGTINGISHSGAASVYNNKIYDLSSNSTNVVINGINVAASGTNNVYNNLIGDLRAPFSTGNIAISGILVGSGTTNNIYHNIVNIASTTSSASTFGTSAIYFSSSTPVNNVRNNIFINNSSAGPTGGYTAALRYTIAPTSTNFPAANNNNLYYAGIPASNALIYGQGSASTATNGQQTLADYKTYIATTLPVAGRESASFTENPTWQSTTGSSANFLKFSTTVPTFIESGGAAIATYTTDFAGTTRNASTPDIGAWELSGQVKVVCNGNPASSNISGTATICAGFSTSLSLTVNYTDIGITYQWASSAVQGGPYNDISGATNSALNTGNLSAGTYYYICKVICSNTSSTYTTAEYAVTANPSPSVGVTQSNTTYCGYTTGPVQLTGTGAVSYKWSPVTNLYTAADTTGAKYLAANSANAVYSTPTASRTYTVTGTGANGCTATFVATPITVSSTQVSAVSFDAVLPVCAGGYAALKANVTQSIVQSAANYGFAQSSGTYTETTGGTGVTGGTTWDDTQIPYTLPFSFSFAGTSYTAISLNPNGYITFGSTASSGYVPISTSTAWGGVVAAFARDLVASTGTTDITALVSGTAPNRTLTFQWKNAYRYSGAAVSGDVLNFQIKLTETTNTIQIVYGSCSATSTASLPAQVGLRGATVADFNNRFSASSWSASTLGTNNVDTITSTNTIMPPSGLTFTYTVPVAGTPTYVWSPNNVSGNLLYTANDGSVAYNGTSSANPIYAQVNAATQYTTSITTGGCTFSRNLTTILSTGAPVVNLTATNTTTRANLNGAAVCGATSVVLNSGITGGCSPFTYRWGSAVGLNDLGTLDSLVVAPLGTTTYYFSVTDNNAQTTSGSIVVNINVLPTVSIAQSGTAYCGYAAGPISLTASGVGAATYTWSPITELYTAQDTTGARYVLNANNAAVFSTPTATRTYTVTATSAAGCTSTATASAISVSTTTVTGVTFDAVLPICAGGYSTLKANVNQTIAANANTYVFAQSSDTYVETTGGTGTLASTSWDDVSAAYTLPFTFKYAGVNYTSIYVNPNGYITFGSTSSSGYTPINSATAWGGVVAAFARDLVASTGTTDVTALVTGTAPNRTLTFQWKNAYRYSLGAIAGDVLNFQIKLNETTNTIQIVYGTCTATSTTTGLSAQVGLRGAANTDFNIRTSATSWSTTALGTTNLDNIATLNTILPVSGLTFTYTPPAPAAPTYVWSPNNISGNLLYTAADGSVAYNGTSSVNPIYAQVNASTQYTVAIGTGGCTFSRNVSTILSTGAPVVNLTAKNRITRAAITGSVCPSTSVTLFSGVTGGCSPFVYKWGTAAGLNDLGTLDTLVKAPLTTTTYYFSVTDNNAQTTSGSITVNVFTVTNVAINASATQYCTPLGDAISLTATNAVNYIWTPITSLYTDIGGSNPYSLNQDLNPVYAKPSGATTYTVTATDANGCVTTATQAISVSNSVTFTAAASANPGTICPGTISTLSATATANPYSVLKITEVTLFRTGTGQTATYPAWLTGGDLVEISNLSSSAVDVSGLSLFDYPNNLATANHPFTFPSGTVIPAQGVAVVVLGTGTDDAANRYFNTGGSSDSWSSGGLVGIVLKNGSAVIDAVGLNSGYTFDAGTGVTANDWSGFAPSLSGNAGTVRTASTDNNAGSDWTTSATVTQTLGAFNTASNYATITAPAVNYNWYETSDLTTSLGTTASIITSALTTTNYTVIADANGCSASSNTTLTVSSASLAAATPTAILRNTTIDVTGTICPNTAITLKRAFTGGCFPYTYKWGTTAGASDLGTADSANVTPTATTTYYFTVTDNNNVSSSSTIVVNAFSVTPVAVSPKNSTLCSPGGAAIALTATNATTYAWTPATGLSAATGASVNATPTATTKYFVTGTDANTCTSRDSATITVVPALLVRVDGTNPIISCLGSSKTLTTTVTANPYSVLKITEITLNRGGTGGNVTFPSWLTGADLVEISNLSSSSIDVSGLSLFDYPSALSTANHPFTFPSGTVIPAQGVAVVVLGTGTDDPTNRYFNTGGTSDSWFSGGLVGIVLKNGSTVIDAVGLNSGYVFAAGTDVTANDWSGFAPSLSGNAGTVRTASTDNNAGSDWTTSATVTQTIGSYNTASNYAPISVGSVIVDYNWYLTSNLTSSIGTSSSLAVNPTVSTGYTVVVNNANCSASTNVTVNPTALPTISAGLDTTICLGGSATLRGSGAGTGGTYSWNNAGSLSAATGTTVTATPTTTTTYTVTGTTSAVNGSCSNTGSVIVTVNNPTVITSNPANQTATANDIVQFTVSATGTGLTYQWQESTDNTAWNNITATANQSGNSGSSVSGFLQEYAGFNSNTLSINQNGDNSNTGFYYRCIVSGPPCGNPASTSAQLTINDVGFASQPSNVALCNGGNTSFTVATTGTVTSYQWQVKVIGGSFVDITNGGIYSTATTASLTITGATAANDSSIYRCVVNGGIATSNEAILRVRTSITINTQPNDSSNCYTGASSTFSVAAVGTGLTYQWQYATSSNGTYSNVLNGTPLGATYTGATGATLTVATTSATPANDYFYRVVLNGTAPCASGIVSDVAKLMVFRLTSPTVAASVTATANTAPTLTATATSTQISGTVRWFTVRTGGTAVSSTATYNLPRLCTPGTSVKYYAEESVGSCASPRDSSTVVTSPLIVSNPANGLICTVGGNVDLSANVTGASSYTWTGAGLSANGIPTVTASPSSSTQYGLTVGTSGSCGNISSTFNVGVIPGSALIPTATPSAGCSNSTVQLNSGLTGSNFAVSSIAYGAATEPVEGVTSIINAGVVTTPLSGGTYDDGGWAGIPIGFTYNFFGNNFTSIAAGTNGLLMFGTVPGYTTAAGNLGQFSFASTNGVVFPNSGNPGNIIALMAGDQWFGSGTTTPTTGTGSLKYWNDGIAPTRRFILQYKNVNNCCSGTNPTFTAQAILYETTGVVEIHIQGKASTNSSTIGLQDATKTIGATAPGRQAFTTAITTPEAWRFVPPASYNYVWSPATNLSSTSITNPVFAAGASQGAYTYNVRVTNPNTGCVADSSVTFSVVGTPSAPSATTSYNYCQNATADTLTASASGTNTLRWYTVATGGTGSTIAPRPSTTAVGTAIFYVSQVTTEGCESARTAISVTTSAAPSNPTATSPITICQFATASALTANATANHTLGWYTASTGGSSSSSITPNTSSTGTTVYYVSQTSNTSFCESGRTPVVVGVFAAPSSPSVTSPVNYCVGATASALTATAGNGNTLNWYTQQLGGTGSTTAPTPSTTNSGSTIYYVSQTNISGCEGTRSALTVNVNAIADAVVSVSASTTSVCNVSSVTFTANPTNGGTSPSYVWYLNNGVVSGQTSATYTNNAPQPGDSVYVEMTVTGVNCLNSNTVTSNNGIKLSASQSTPTISISASSSNICSGASVTFSSVLSNGGATPSFKWYRNGNLVTGQTGSSYTSTTFANGDVITAELTSSLDPACLTSTTANSNNVTINHNAATQISVQPVSLTQCSGTNASFTVTASGTGNITYQWRRNNVNIPGNATAQTNNLVINNIAAGNTGSYTVIVTGTCGSVTSSAATLALSAVTSITTQPTARTVCAGADATFTVVGAGTGTLTYQWRKNSIAITGNSSATTASLTVPAVTAGDAGLYSVIVTGDCGSVTSNAVLLSVNPATAITVQPASVNQCSNTNVSLSVQASGSGTLTYVWRLGNNVISNGGNVSGATSANLLVTSATNANVGKYTVTVSGSCGSATSDTATLALNGATVITTQPISKAACLGTNTWFSVQGSGSGTLTYQWKKGNSNLNGQTGDTLKINNVTAGDAGTYSVIVTSSCGSITSSSVTLSVRSQTSSTTNLSVCTSSLPYIWNGLTFNGAGSQTANLINAGGCDSSATLNLTIDQPAIGGTPSSLIVCSGFQPTNNISLVGSFGSVIRWEKSTDITFATGVTNIVNNTTTLTAAEVGTVSTVTYIRARLQSGVCAAIYSENGVLTPVVTLAGSASSQTVCVTGSGTAPSNDVVLTGYQGVVIKWQKSIDASFTTGVVDIASTSTSLQGSLVGPINATTYVRALVQNSTCSELYSSNGTLTTFDGTPSTISISTNITPICSGSNTVFTAVASNPGTSPVYQWKRNGNVVGTNSTTLAFASNTLSTGDVIVCTVTSSNPCASPAVATSNTLTLSVTPSPAVGAIYKKGISTPVTAASLCSFTDTLFVVNYTYGNTIWSSTNTSVATITPVVGDSRNAYILPVASGATNIVYTLQTSGCASTASFQLKVAPVTTPTAITSTGNATAVCVGSTLQLSSSTPSLGQTGVWTVPTVTRGTISNTGLLRGSSAGSATVVYTIANDSGCSSFTQRTITVNAIPAVPSITYAPGTVGNPQLGAPTGGFCIGRKFAVAGVPTGGRWSFTNTGVATITDSLVAPNNWWGKVSIIGIGSGNIRYTLTNSNGCSNSRLLSGNGVICASKGIDINSDVTKPVLDFSLYPNPAKGKVSFNIDFVEAGGRVILTDMFGKQVKTQSLTIGTNQVEISTLSKGFYLVSVITNDGNRTTKKLIVE